MNGPIVKEITCREVHAICQSRPIDLIDVRSLEEFQGRRAVGARNMPIETFEPHAVAAVRKTAKDEPVYFICEMGGRSAWACGLMMASGYPNVVNVVGGTHEWELEQLPLERGA